MRRKSERGGVLGMPHAAPVHRLHMHAPERPQSDRTIVGARAKAMAYGPSALLRPAVAAVASKLFLAQFPQIFRTLAQSFRTYQMAHPLLERRPRKVALAAIFVRPRDALDTRPQHTPTSTDSYPFPRNVDPPSVILHANEGTRRAAHCTSQQCAETGRLPTTETHSKIKRKGSAWDAVAKMLSAHGLYGVNHTHENSSWASNRRRIVRDCSPVRFGIARIRSRA
jgi:hypothetical protein